MAVTVLQVQTCHHQSQPYLQGVATGTLLYVVFFEVIEKERQKGTSGLVQVSLSWPSLQSDFR